MSGATEQKFKIRCMKADESERVAVLVRSLQEHQKMKNVPKLPSGQDIADDLLHKDEGSGNILGNNCGTYVLVAIDMSKLDEPNQAYVVGYLIYSQAFSIISGRHFWMNSFFIQKEYRRHGLGRKFMEFMRLHALSTGNKLVDVPFMNNNEPGKKFYNTFGAYLVNELYLIMGKQLDN